MNAMISAKTFDGFVRGVKILMGGQVQPPGIACHFGNAHSKRLIFYSSGFAKPFARFRNQA